MLKKSICSSANEKTYLPEAKACSERRAIAVPNSNKFGLAKERRGFKRRI